MWRWTFWISVSRILSWSHWRRKEVTTLSTPAGTLWFDSRCRAKAARKRHEGSKNSFRWKMTYVSVTILATCFKNWVLVESHDWRVFIDSSPEVSNVFFCNGNQDPSIPVGHSVRVKKPMKKILNSENYIFQHMQIAGLWWFWNN